VTMEATTIQRQ
jgi:hypothetical protein